jgi:DNA-directed RNA polymerase specialized sigma24 family protein
MPVEDENSVTRLLSILKGEGRRVDVDRAVEVLWERYFYRLVGLARYHLRKLARVGGGLNAPEDLVVSAFHSFYRRAAAGLFPCLDDRHDLWKLLVTITGRKAAREYRRKRPEMTLGDAIDLMIAREPTPELAAELADQVRHRLSALPDDVQRSIALMKMEGFTNEEIASRQGCHVATVERKLKMIRTIWSADITD